MCYGTSRVGKSTLINETFGEKITKEGIGNRTILKVVNMNQD